MAERKVPRSNKDLDQIVPKKKWNTLGEVRDYLVQANVPIVEFNGYRLLTDKYWYGIVDSILYIQDIKKLPPPEEKTKRTHRPKLVEKAKKNKIPNPPKKSKNDILAQMKARGEKLLENKRESKK